jgi:hypothetical protein
VHVPAKVFLDVITESILKRFGLSLTYLGLVDNGWTGWVDGHVGERMSTAQVEGLTAEWVNGWWKVSAWIREWDLSKLISCVRRR